MTQFVCAIQAKFHASLKFLCRLGVVLGDVGVTALGVLIVRLLDLLLRRVPRDAEHAVVVLRPEPGRVQKAAALGVTGGYEPVRCDALFAS